MAAVDWSLLVRSIERQEIPRIPVVVGRLNSSGAELRAFVQYRRNVIGWTRASLTLADTCGHVLRGMLRRIADVVTRIANSGPALWTVLAPRKGSVAPRRLEIVVSDGVGCVDRRRMPSRILDGEMATAVDAVPKRRLEAQSAGRFVRIPAPIVDDQSLDVERLVPDRQVDGGRVPAVL